MSYQTLKTYKVTAAANTTGVVVKPDKGGLYGWTLFNNSAAKIYVKLYDLAVAPTVGTTVPKLVIGIPAATNVTVALPNSLWFGNGIAYGITTGIADNDTTAPTANDVVGALLWL